MSFTIVKLNPVKRRKVAKKSTRVKKSSAIIFLDQLRLIGPLSIKQAKDILANKKLKKDGDAYVMKDGSRLRIVGNVIKATPAR